MSRLRQHWFLVGLTLAVLGGILLPEGGAKLRGMKGLLTALTALSLFLSGLSLDGSRLRRVTELRGVLLGFCAVYVAAPLVGYAMGWLWAPGRGGDESTLFLQAVMIVAAQASTIASGPALTLIAGGNQALALLITVSTHLSTAVLTPLLLRASIGAVVEFPLAEMMRSVAAVVLLPVVLAQLVRLMLSEAVQARLPRAVRFSQAIILIFVYTGVSAAAGALGGQPSLLFRFFGAAVSLHLLLVAGTDRASRWLGLSAPSRAAVVLCGSQKTLPNGIYLWDTFFSANPNGAVPLVLYHVFQLVFDTLLVPWLKEKPVAEVIEEAEDLVDGA